MESNKKASMERVPYLRLEVSNKLDFTEFGSIVFPFFPHPPRSFPTLPRPGGFVALIDLCHDVHLMISISIGVICPPPPPDTSNPPYL